MSTNGQREQAPSGPKWTLEPWDKYRDRKAALAPDDPIRSRLDGLEFEMRRDPFLKDRCYPLETEAQTNRYWVFHSSASHDPPFVFVAFRMLNQKVIPLQFWARETFTCSDDTLADRFP